MEENILQLIKDLDSKISIFADNFQRYKQYFFKDEEKNLIKFNTTELFLLCYLNNIEILSFSPAENKLLLKDKYGTILATDNRYFNISEVIAYDTYSVPQLYEFEDFVVFDIGMNRGYASLRFAEFNNCSRVYGFEIDDVTYNKAVYHKKLNPQLADKLRFYNFGISDKNSSETLYYVKGADTKSTIEADYVDMQYPLKAAKDKVETKIVEVRRASDVIENIIKEDNIKSKIVLKIDTEGSEYKIIDDLIQTNAIQNIDLIMGEVHKFVDDQIDLKLENAGFKLIKMVDGESVYTFAYVKEEYFDKWILNE